MDKKLVIIATDGSAKKAGTGFDCASGCCVYTPQDRNFIVNFEKLDDDATVSVAEITGVLLGLKAISGMDKSKYDFVFLIDSQILKSRINEKSETFACVHAVFRTCPTFACKRTGFV